jgi:adenylate cyclase
VTEQRVQRRLAAILAADVVGYSAHMERAEEATYAEFERLKRELIEPTLSRHEGRLIKTTGDGALAEFASPLAAIKCAVEIQDRLASGSSPLRLRVGLNLGDVIVGQDGDLYGDGINIAVRLEGIADPGGILISEKVYSEVAGKLDAGFEDRGEQQLKNISKPVHAYALCSGAHSAPIEKLGAALPLPDKPSIAVLPFENMSGDPEQEYFADGVVEDIITALSRFKSLFVIARNSSFTYKGRSVDVKQIGRELGVRYVLEGSVRKAGSRVRITGQLVDALTRAHLWADRFDGGLEDIFDLQDRVTESVVGAIAPAVERAEIDRTKQKPTENLQAYDCYLRAIAGSYRGTELSLRDALLLSLKATDVDPDFASAYGVAAYCYLLLKGRGWMDQSPEEIARAERLARRAAELGKDDADTLCRSGLMLAHLGDFKSGTALVDRALELNANSATIWIASGWLRVWCGEADVALQHIDRATRLSPVDPQLPRMQAIVASAYFVAGQYEKAVAWSEKSLLGDPNFSAATRIAAASLALCDRLEEARTAVLRVRQVDPTLRISNLDFRLPWRRPADRARLVKGLRKAGLPE